MPSLQELQAKINEGEERLAEIRQQRDAEIDAGDKQLATLKAKRDEMLLERNAQTQNSLVQFFDSHGDFLDELNALSSVWRFPKDDEKDTRKVSHEEEEFAQCVEHSFRRTKEVHSRMLEVFKRLEADFNAEGDPEKKAEGEAPAVEDTAPSEDPNANPNQVELQRERSNRARMFSHENARASMKWKKAFHTVEDQEKVKAHEKQKLPWNLKRTVNAAVQDKKLKSEGLLRDMVDILQNRKATSGKPQKGVYPNNEPPEVEVGIHVHKLRNLDTAAMQFEADIDVFLEWRDDNMKDMTGEKLLELDWANDFFDPEITVSNASTLRVKGMEVKNNIPRFKKKSHDGRPRLQDGGYWMKKRYQFGGVFKMQTMSVEKFPCDLQKMSIIIKAESFRTHPIFKVPPSLKKSTYWGEEDALAIFCDESSLQQYKIIAKRSLPMSRSDLGKLSAKDPMVVKKADRCDHFVVEIWAERLQRSHHWYSLMFVFVLPMVCMSSVWDIASPSISSRLSICLLVILAMTEYTSHRPSPIEKSAYMTTWDWVLIINFVFLSLLLITNTVSVTICGGFHEEAPQYMQDDYQNHEETCSMGWCYSRKIDCTILLVFLSLFVALLMGLHLYQQAQNNEEHLAEELERAKNAAHSKSSLSPRSDHHNDHHSGHSEQTDRKSILKQNLAMAT